MTRSESPAHRIFVRHTDTGQPLGFVRALWTYHAPTESAARLARNFQEQSACHLLLMLNHREMAGSA